MVRFGDPQAGCAVVADLGVGCRRFDELHPSEQSDRIVAREIANEIIGIGSKYATWFS